MAIRAVTFDFWNTLVREDPTLVDRRIAAWQQVLAEAGHRVEVAELKRAFGAGWDEYVAAWRDNRMFGARDLVPLAVAALGVRVDEPVVEQLVEVVVSPPADHYPRLNPNIVETLEALRAAGVAVGIICDVGLTPSTVLRRYLEQQGALHLFDHWSFSDEVGTYKPDPRIFEHALSGLGGVDPSEAAHVGDLRRTDIAGARAMGMVAVRYTGVADDPVPDDHEGPVVEGHHVLDDHADLPAALGIT